jgi:hypothetical protein
MEKETPRKERKKWKEKRRNLTNSGESGRWRRRKRNGVVGEAS